MFHYKESPESIIDLFPLELKLYCSLLFYRVLVLHEGSVAEFDSPDRLLKDTSSTFYQLAVQAGIIENNKTSRQKLGTLYITE